MKRIRWHLLARPAAVLFAGGLAISLPACKAGSQDRLLVAPMIQGIDLCQSHPADARPGSEAELAALCHAQGQSPAALIESALADLGTTANRSRRYELGYTLPVPLLKLFVDSGTGWRIDQPAVERLAATVRETDRPLVLHLFSTHFSVGAPIEVRLASDPANLAHSPSGPMPKDTFLGMDVYPWTPASTDNDITRYRRAAIGRVLDAMCQLPESDRRKIRAVTLLGEVHQFHADFERGMGVSGDYVVSDYSETSVKGFRSFLAGRFKSIDALNSMLGTRFASFDDVAPPDRDIRRRADSSLVQHIDSAAGGSLPLTGWAFDETSTKDAPVWVRIYRNGEQIARVPARYGRQDVLQARPAFGTADVGWRHDMDFTSLAGTYRFDFLVERAGGSLVSLGSRRVAFAKGPIVDLPPAPAVALPPTGDSAGLQGHVDFPTDSSVFFFNPLVPLWHEYRNLQVIRYLADFERLVRGSCLADVPLYTHQIAPFVNPSWDASKFAADASLQGVGGLRLGISLYGEATYGHSFFDWLGTTRHRDYGVTEFHPLKSMSPEQMRSVLDRHRQHGATFVSFFLDVRPKGIRDEAKSNIFAFDPSNSRFASDALYGAVQAVLND